MRAESRISQREAKARALHPAILSIDLAANFRDAIALLRVLRRIQHLVLTIILSGRRVAIDEAREKGKVPHVFIAFAIAIEPIENIRHRQECFFSVDSATARIPCAPTGAIGNGKRSTSEV